MKSLFIITLGLLICCCTGYTQQSNIAQGAADAGFKTRKIYIHYDKEYYVAGETIWFKAYLFQNRKPDGQTNNFYIQLFDKDGHHVITKKYPVKGAAVAGDISLADSLPQGYYTIRAITPAMLNSSSPGSYYQKDLFVFNPSGNSSSQPFDKSSALNIRFFPESGYLADGILMNMGFLCTDSMGHPAEVNGYIMADDTVVVAPFKTLHDGMGRVQFKPYAAKKYTAVVTIKDLKQFFPLPDIKKSGINLRVEDENRGKVFTLSRTIKDKQDYGRLTLVAATSDGVVFENEVSFDTYMSVKGHIITDSLPSGILHFTVLNNEGLPLAERISFVNNREYSTAATAVTEKKGTGPKEENIIAVTFPEIIQRSCSVSVTALADKDQPAADNIISSLLLSSALRGYIRNPAWYFSDTSATYRLALDNLMMIQGWSSISVKKETAAAGNNIPPADDYLLRITGLLKDAKTKVPLSGGRLSIFYESEDSVNHNYEVDVDANGHFTIDSLLLRGEASLYYGYTSAKGKEMPADISIDIIPADSMVTILPVTVTSCCSFKPPVAEGRDQIKQRYQAGTSRLQETKTLDPVVVKTFSSKRPIDEVNEKYSRGVFTALGKVNIDNIHDPENDKTLSVFDYIKRTVKQVTVEDDKFVNYKNRSLFLSMSGDKFTQKERSLDSQYLLTAGNTPGDKLAIESSNFREAGKHFEVAIFLNEHPAYSGLLKTLKMDEVALIKYYEPGFVGAGGTDGPGGAIAVYTKKEMTTPSPGLEKLDRITYKGYAIEKKFYSPDYNLPSADRSVPDYRTTLYWDPEIYTNEQSTAIKIRYFNSDISNRMKITMEGFDVNGRLIHIEKIIE